MRSVAVPDAPLRILHLCSIKGRGGTGYMAGRVCRLLHEAGHQVWVGACPESKVAERAVEQGLPLLSGLHLRRGFRPVSLATDVRLIRRAIREHDLQIVHAWHSIEYWTAALAVTGTPTRLARTRGLVTPISPHFFNRLLHRRTGAVFATCRRIAENYRAAGLGMDNVFPLVDGVDVQRFRPGLDGGAVRAALGIPLTAPLIASIGRLEPVKDQATLLRALAKLPADVHALFAGDGSQRVELERLAGELALTGRAHFLGVRADIPELLAAADIYCLCSVGSEGSSRATLEALACGLPCVTTLVGMLPDIIKPGRTGLLFPPGGIDALAECLDNLLADSTLRRRLGEAGRRLAESAHSEATMVDSVIEVYRRMLNRAEHG